MSAPDPIAAADDALLSLDAASAKDLLADPEVAARAANSRIARMLGLAVQALEHWRAGNLDTAKDLATRAQAGKLPLPGLLRASAEVLRATGDYARACDCLLRLEKLGHDHLKDFLEALPNTEAVAFLPLVRHVYDSRPIANLYLMQSVKHLLPTALEPEDAVSVYTRLFGLPAEMPGLYTVTRALDYARQAGQPLRTVFKPQPFRLREPRRVGQPPVETPELTGRQMFYSLYDDVLAVGRSSFVWKDHLALVDAQGDELSCVVPNFNIDPQVLRERAGQLHALPPPARRSRRMGRAIHLLGWSSNFFGHWMTEYLPKVAAMMADERLAGVPLLIDEEMPAQHREALDLLIGDRHPVVTVPIWGSVRVRKLWWCSTAMYVPMLPKLTQSLDATHMSAPPERFAPLLELMRRRFADALGPVRRGRRLFLARGPGRRRKMQNRAAVEAIATSYGFDIVHPEKLSFTEQLKLAREATHIVGPEGSGLMLAYFAEPGTRLCMLNHEFLENLATMSGTLEALGVETSIIYGRTTRRDENARYSDYLIAPDTLHALFAYWGLEAK